MAVGLCLNAVAQTAPVNGIERLCVGPGGVQPNGDVTDVDISFDGRFVAFTSGASNLVLGDTNSVSDVFVLDRSSGAIERVNLTAAGGQAVGNATTPTISGDGMLVGFVSSAAAFGGTDATPAIYVHNRATGATYGVSPPGYGGIKRISHSPDFGNGGSALAWQTKSDYYPCINGWYTPQIGWDIYFQGQVTCGESYGSEQPAVSGNGVAVFVTSLSSFQVTTSNGHRNLAICGQLGPSFVALGDHSEPDVNVDASRIVSLRPDGPGQNSVWCYSAGVGERIPLPVGAIRQDGTSSRPRISGDGRWIAFSSTASNLVNGDQGSRSDIFLYDLATQSGRAVSLAGCTTGNGDSTRPAISGDGRFVAFVSSASDLVAADTNGVTDLFIFDRTAVCYRDQDGDGWGDTCQPLPGQPPGPGWSALPHDCDDNNPARNPGVAEACNGIDDNCNGVVDEGLLDTYFVDADGDGFGDSSQAFDLCAPQPLFSLLEGDCDDHDPTVYPGAPEICDGLDNDCNGSIDPGFISTYCTAGTTVFGCVPSISGEGAPSSSSPSGFDIVVSNVPAQRYGLIFYGSWSIPQPQPWALGSSSYLCIYLPTARTGVQDTGGVAGTCTGELRVDFNQFMANNPAATGSPFHAGQVLHAQGWFRDPGAAKQTNLSNALTFTLCN